MPTVARASGSAVGRVHRTRPAESARSMGSSRAIPRTDRGGGIHAPDSSWCTDDPPLAKPLGPRLPPLLWSWQMSRALRVPGPVGPGYTPRPHSRRDPAAGRVRRTRCTGVYLKAVIRRSQQPGDRPILPCVSSPHSEGSGVWSCRGRTRARSARGTVPMSDFQSPVSGGW